MDYIKNERFFKLKKDDMVDSKGLTYITQFRGEYKNAKVKKRKQYNIRKKNRKNQIDVMTFSISANLRNIKLKRNENKHFEIVDIDLSQYVDDISNFIESEKTVSDIKSLYQTIEEIINYMFDGHIKSHGKPYFIRHNTIIKTIIYVKKYSYILFFRVKSGENLLPAVEPLSGKTSTNRIRINKDHRIYYDPTTDHINIHDYTYLFDICTGFMARLNKNNGKSICRHGNYVMKHANSKGNHVLRLRYKCAPVTIQSSFITLIDNKMPGYSNTFHRYKDQIYNKDIYFYDQLCFCKLTLNDGSTVELEGSGELTYNMISNYKSTLVSAVIGKSCTSISGGVFNECTGLTNVNIANSVTSIGADAFAGCTSLKNITIPNSVTSIGTGSFSECSSLKSITIPDSVTTINDFVFYGCTGLTSATIPDSITSIGVRIFEGCKSLSNIISLATTAPTIQNDTFINIKTGGILTVTSESTGYDTWMSTDDYYLGKYDWTIKYKPYNGFCKLILNNGSTVELKGCSELTSSMIEPYTSTLISVVIGKLCTSIEDETFMGCEELINAIIPDSITSIGNYAFGSCARLTSITISDSVTNIGQYAFNECTGLISIIIGNSVTSIGDSTFEGCTNLTSITIPDSVTSIGRYAFYGCIGLTNITIPDSVINIGEGAFNYCNSLTIINVNSNNTVYDSRNNCNAIIETETNTLVHGCKTTIIPDNITSIGNYAFQGCTGLISITIPDSVTSIGNYAFTNCSGLTSITSLATTAPTITSSTFRIIKTGGTLTVPSGSTGYNAWMSTSNYYLGKYNWTIKEIYMGLCKLTLNNGSTVELEGSGALTSSMISPYQSTLVNAEIGTLCTNIGNDAFSGCTSLTSIIIPDNVTSIGSFALNGCIGLTSIIVPDSVTSIGSCAFARCTSLISINVNDGNTVYDSRNNCNAIIKTETNTLVQGCKTTIIPNSVTNIGYGSFFGCTDLTSITIPDSVTSIGGSAFYECTSLTSITIPDSITSIDSGAFYECTGLTSITSLATIAPTIQSTTFRDIKTGGILTVPSGSTGYNNWMSTGDYYLGKYNWTIKEIYMGFCKLTLNDSSTVELEGSGTLTFSMISDYKSTLVNAEIGTLCTSIDSSAFSYCSHLTSVIIGNNVTSIGSSTFANCRVLANITSLATTAPTIQNNTFQNVKVGGTLTVPSGSTGYDTWMSRSNYYLGKSLWKKVEQ